MVRLRGGACAGKALLMPAFQFQNGAIERLLLMLLMPALMPFQFQNGAIESFCAHTLFGWLWNFNSKMVRLRVKNFNIKFRPRYVISIPKWCDWEVNWVLNYEQFTQISIPKWCDWEAWKLLFDLSHPYFNSKMVRLREDCQFTSLLLMSNFNSKMVRLRVCCN